MSQPTPAKTDASTSGSSSGGDAKSRYKDSLNLPKTTFPMKANLVQNEPASLKRWDKANLYIQVQQQRAASGKGRFVFHDGPPYANGSIHLGHLLNKCLKDFVVRIKLMEGLTCPYVPGWDCHGLPIEHKVMQELQEKGSLAKLATLPPDQSRMAIRRECQKYAEKFVKHQAGQMKRLLTLADYEHPYLTMAPAYEGATLEVFASLVEQGLVYRQLKAVHWSIANETALAEAELEYQDREDISVYVDFESLEADKVYDAFGLPPATDDDEDDEGNPLRGTRPHTRPSFMIWTTTPWTLPANLAIAVNPEFDYALVRVDGNITVIAANLVDKVTKSAKAEEVTILATTKGDKLVGLYYHHPFLKAGEGCELTVKGGYSDGASFVVPPTKPWRVVAADYVTLEDGTGLVHTAPGHGAEDYQTGVREGLPIYCPVLPNGTYDNTTAEWLRGQSIWDANPKVVEHLRNSGHLFYDHKFTHSYPHDWRSKTPVIFRATEQWFIGVDLPRRSDARTLRQTALDETAHGVNFVPEWGKNRMRGMLESRPDWCISRQRAWGLPIPAFYETNTSTGDEVTLLSPASVRAVAKLIREKGSDCWFQLTPRELLKYYDYEADVKAGKAHPGHNFDNLKKSSDIFDVWFESGSSWNAVMRERSGGGDAGTDYPIDLYLEGSDQHRGWFQLSLLPALGVTGRPPFKSVLTHGFMVDKDGHKMSKSVGNTLDVDDLVTKFGSDVCRWWVATLAYESDIKSDLSFFDTAGDSYRKIRNTIRFMLSNLDDYISSPPGKDCTSGEGMCIPFNQYPPTSIDTWILSALNDLVRDVRAAYAAYNFREATNLLYNFCNDTLSAIYLAAVKDRLYCDKPDSPRRRRTQSTLFDLTSALVRLLAPVIPHTADEAWRALYKITGDNQPETCVQLKTFPEPYPVNADEGWKAALLMRETALRTLEAVRAKGEIENPLDAGLVLPDPEGILAKFDPHDLADLLGVSRAPVDKNAKDVKVQDLRNEPRCERSWKRDTTVKRRSDGGTLSDRDAAAVGVQ